VFLFAKELGDVLTVLDPTLQVDPEGPVPQAPRVSLIYPKDKTSAVKVVNRNIMPPLVLTNHITALYHHGIEKMHNAILKNNYFENNLRILAVKVLCYKTILTAKTPSTPRKAKKVGVRCFFALFAS